MAELDRTGPAAPGLPRSATSVLAWLPECVRYALHPFLVHSGADQWLMPRDREVLVGAIDGAVFSVDLNDEIAREILHFGAYEKRNIEIIRLLSDGQSGSFLDIGANLGGHTVLLAKHFNRIAAFEPNPATLERLHRNLALNGIDAGVAHGFGLSDVDADLAFHAESGSNPGKSRFLEETTPASVTLRVRNGDDAIGSLALSPVAAVKIDVEGHEERVLAGLSRTIAQDRPAVFFEWDASRNGPGCFERLTSYRFFAQPWEIGGGRWRRPFARGLDATRPPRLTPVSPESLAGRYVSMVVALPDERAETLLSGRGVTLV